MTALSDLFPEGPRADSTGDAPIDDHHTVWRLREMIGEPREARGPARPLADSRALIRMAEAAQKTAVPVGVDEGEPTGPSKRPRRRFDPLATAAVVLSVVAVATAAAVGGVQMATASPAASSLKALEADEAAIQNAHQSLSTGRDRIVADIESQTADAALLRAALVSTSTTPDPASDRGTLIDVTDAAALAPALAAMDAHTAGLSSISVPELPAEYVRAGIDEESLTEVGGAIDSAQEQLVALDAATAEMRTLRTQLDQLRPQAELAVTAYAGSFVEAADAARDRYPDADEALHAALSEAAIAVGSANLWETTGASTLERYREAFGAVVADQLRADIQREQEQNTRQPSRNPAPQPTDPPTDTTDPSTGDPTTPEIPPAVPEP